MCLSKITFCICFKPCKIKELNTCYLQQWARTSASDSLVMAQHERKNTRFYKRALVFAWFYYFLSYTVRVILWGTNSLLSICLFWRQAPGHKLPTAPRLPLLGSRLQICSSFCSKDPPLHKCLHVEDTAFPAHMDKVCHCLMTGSSVCKNREEEIIPHGSFTCFSETTTTKSILDKDKGDPLHVKHPPS